MKLASKNKVCIIIVLVCAFLMVLEFGGNYDSFYDFLAGTDGFNRIDMPDDSLFVVLSWVYLVSLVGVVIFGLTESVDLSRVCAYISSGAMGIFNVFGIYGLITVNSGELCIGMPLLLVATIALMRINASTDRK